MKNQVLFVSIGQGGGNIVDEFALLGYRTLAINSCKEDLLSLKNVKKTYHIPGAEGSQRDLEVGELLALQNMESIIKVIEKEAEDCSIVFFNYSLSGGTGAGGGPVIAESYIDAHMFKYNKAQEEYEAILTEVDDDQLNDIAPPSILKKVFPSILILPSVKESIKLNQNATRSLEATYRIPGLGVIFPVDNDKAKNGEYTSLNKKVSKHIDNLLSAYDNKSDSSSRGIIDKNDIKKMLAQKGFGTLFSLSPNKTVSTSKRILEALENGGSTDCFCDMIVEGNSFNIACGVFPNTEFDTNNLYEDMGEPLDYFYTYNDDAEHFFGMIGTTIKSERMEATVAKANKGAEKMVASIKAKSAPLIGNDLLDFSEAEKYMSSMTMSKASTRRSLDMSKALGIQEVVAEIDKSNEEVAVTKPKTAAERLREKLLAGK